MADNSYVDMGILRDTATQLKTAATELTTLSGTLGTAGGDVSNGWSDDNSAKFAQRFGEFSEATGKLIAEISNYASFLEDSAGKYEAAQQSALSSLGG